MTRIPMRIIAGFFILAVTAFQLNGQVVQQNQTFTLNTTHTVNTHYQASERIDLETGFTTTSLDVTSKFFRASIHPFADDLAVTGSEHFPDIDDSKAIGRLEGQWEVTDMGAFIYRIPIRIPAGTGGLEPEISIVYDSYKDRGMLGEKWSVGGLGSITRLGKDPDHEGIFSRPEFASAQDYLTLNGTRLIPFNGAQGGNQTQYYTEVDNYGIITGHQNSSSSGSYFTYMQRDGVTHTYGSNDGKQLPNHFAPTEWRLSETVDNHGNFVEYIYDSNTSESNVVLQEIRYTGNKNTGQAGYNKIVFKYHENQDQLRRKFYHHDHREYIEYNELIQQIEVYSEGNLVYKYLFEYEHEGNLFSRLKTIRLSNASGEEINSTLIHWRRREKQTPPALDNVTTGVAGGGATARFLFDNLLGDYGTPEMLVYDQKGHPFPDYNEVVYRLNSFDQSTGEYELLKSGTFDFSDVVGDTTIQNIRMQAVNIDDDAQADVAVEVETAKLKHLRFFEWSESANDFVPFATPRMDNLHNGPVRSKSDHVVLADIDYDGITDVSIARFYESPFSTPKRRKDYLEFHLSVNNYVPLEYQPKVVTTQKDNRFYGGVSFQYATTSSAQVYFFGTYAQTLDVNGNPTDIKWGQWFYRYDKQSNSIQKVSFTDIQVNQNTLADADAFADFDGDGITEYLRYTDYNPATQFAEFWLMDVNDVFGDFDYSNTPKPAGFFPGDFNGDGFMDVAAVYDKDNGGVIRFYLYKRAPQQFGCSPSSETCTPVFDLAYTYTNDHTFHEEHYAVADLNDDGYDELVYKKGGESRFRVVSVPLAQNDLATDMVDAIRDGYGEVLNVAYDHWWNTATDIGAAYPDLAAPDYAVSKFGNHWHLVASRVFRTCDNGFSIDQAYAYENPLFNYASSGFMGFAHMQVHKTQQRLPSGDLEMVVRRRFLKRPALHVPALLDETTVTDHADLLTGTNFQPVLRKTVEYNETVNRNSGTYDSWRLFPSTIRTTDYLNNTETLESTGRDINGNTLFRESVITGLGDQHYVKQRVDYSDFVETGNTGFPNRPQTITTTNTRHKPGGYTDVFSPTRSLTYYQHGKPQTITDNSQSDKALETDFRYDAYGNVISRTTKAAIPVYGEERTYTQVYDELGRFVTLKRDPFNYETQITYNRTWGKPASVTDPNGRTESHTYDSWGRPLHSDMADGTTADYSYQWAKNEVSSGRYKVPTGLYKVLKQGDGTPSEIKHFDARDLEIYSRVQGPDGDFLNQLRFYRIDGQLETESLQSKKSHAGNPDVITCHYDRYGRLKQKQYPDYTLDYTYNQLERTYTFTGPEEGYSFGKELYADGSLREKQNQLGESIFYRYHPGNGEPSEMTTGHKTISIGYDDRGYRTQYTDPDIGTREYNHNAYGELVSSLDEKNNQYTYTYAADGQLLSRTGPEGPYIFTYGSGNNDKRKLVQAIGPEGDITDLLYNERSLLQEKTISYNGESHRYRYSYDGFENLSERIFPTGVALQYRYNDRNYLQKIVYGNAALWQLGQNNGFGEITEAFAGNGWRQNRQFDRYGNLQDHRVSGNGQNVVHKGYRFRSFTHNLAERWDYLNNRHEAFNYDDLNRLTQVSMNGQVVQEISYHNGFTMRSLSDVGDYYYDDGKPSQLTQVSRVQWEPTHVNMDIAYTGFDKARTLSLYDVVKGLNTTTGTIAYNHDQQRLRYTVTEDGATLLDRLYLEDYTRETTDAGTIHHHWVYGPTGLVADIRTQDAQEPEALYTVTDYLGSINAVGDASGALLEYLDYDAWGRNRNPQTGQLTRNITGSSLVANLGYTGHEHLPTFDLINMLGRMYDPVTCKMLSPDIVVQNIENTGSYDPYGYAFNNPLKYNDPTGFLAASPRSLAPETNFDNFDEANYHTFIYGSSTTAWQDHGFDGNGGSGSFTGEGDQSGSGQDGDGSAEKKGEEGNAFVFVETDGIGHTYIMINETVFSYGRYNGSYSPASGAFGPIGDGVLLKYTDDKAQEFIRDHINKSPTNVYMIDNIDTDKVFGFFNELYKSGTRLANGGKVVDTYYLFGNNCTSQVCNGLRAGGSSIPVFQTPVRLDNFLMRIEKMKNGWNPGEYMPWVPKF